MTSLTKEYIEYLNINQEEGNELGAAFNQTRLEKKTNAVFFHSELQLLFIVFQLSQFRFESLW